MNGAILIGFLVLAIIFFIVAKLDEWNEDIFITFGIIFMCLAMLWIIAIPISRMDSKTNVEYLKTLQVTIDYNRQNDQDLNVLERTAIITEINECNMKITTWKIKGQKWYNNRWYYHPSTQSAVHIK